VPPFDGIRVVPPLDVIPAGGDIVDRDGRVLGRHGGHHGFTVGQRRGIGVSAAEPLYVLSKDARRNRVVVGPRAALATRRVGLSPVQLHRPQSAVQAVRLRYGAPAIPCTPADPEAGAREGLVLELDRDVRGAAPGQTACLTRGDLVVGWGTIAGG
jgi:tRNA-specific 2-thiouridylase